MAREVTELTDVSEVAHEAAKRKYAKNDFYSQLVADKPSLTKEEYKREMGRYNRLKRDYEVALNHLNKLKRSRR